MTKTSLIIILGDGDYDFAAYDCIFTLSPIRQAVLKQGNITAELLGDYSLDMEAGQRLDVELLDTIEKCLKAEAEENEIFKWMPVALQQIRWSLFHYLWLKGCLKRVIEKWRPTEIIVSAKQYTELNHALGSLAREYNYKFTILEGAYDEPVIVGHRAASYDLPREVDPLWFVSLRWNLIKLFKGHIGVFYQYYWNMAGANISAGWMSFNHNRAINFLGSAVRKVLRLCKWSSEKGIEDSFDYGDISAETSLKSTEWNVFSGDEQDIIRFAAGRFLANYSPAFMEKIVRRFLKIFELMRPERLILMADQVCSARMLSCIAHKANVLTDDLLHGIALEDYSGRARASVFCPDRYICWNEASAAAYRQLGWDAVSVMHPRNLKSSQPLQPITKAWSDVRILVLAPEWNCITMEGRPDCFEHSLLNIREGLSRLGVPDQNIHVKCHPASQEIVGRKMKALADLRERLGFHFSVAPTYTDSSVLIPQFDLVISSVCSGIFETVLAGVPLLVYSNSLKRVGALASCVLPCEDTPGGIVNALRHYDYTRVAAEYEKLVHSLQASKSLPEITGSRKTGQKIVLFTENYFSGGMDTFIITLINHWPAGDEFVLVCNYDHPGLERIEKSISPRHKIIRHHCLTKPQVERACARWPGVLRLTIKALMLPAQYLLFLFYLGYFTVKFKVIGADKLIVCNGGYPAGDTCRAVTMTGLFNNRWGKPAFIFHNDPVPVSWFKIPAENLVDWLVQKGAACLVTVSQHTQKQLANRPILNRCPKKEIIYNAILGPQHKNLGNIRAELNLPEDSQVILMLGTYEPRKGHEFLFKAFRKVINQVDNVYLLVAGYGYPDDVARLNFNLRMNGLSSRVLLLGFREDAMDILQQSQVLVMPSQSYESFGLTIIEAMAAKVPVVATNVGGMPEVLQDGRGGFLVEQNVESFAGRIIELLKDRNLCIKMGEDGHKVYHERFRPQQMSKQYYKLVCGSGV